MVPLVGSKSLIDWDQHETLLTEWSVHQINNCAKKYLVLC